MISGILVTLASKRQSATHRINRAMLLGDMVSAAHSLDSTSEIEERGSWREHSGSARRLPSVVVMTSSNTEYATQGVLILEMNEISLHFVSTVLIFLIGLNLSQGDSFVCQSSVV